MFEAEFLEVFGQTKLTSELKVGLEQCLCLALLVDLETYFMCPSKHRLAGELVTQLFIITSPSDSGFSTVKASFHMHAASGEKLELLILT